MKEHKPKKNKKKIFPIILVILLAAGGTYAWIKYSYGLTHEDTDDAQLESNISPVSPRTAGYVTAINFEENQRVKKGDTLVKLDDRDLRLKILQAEAAVKNAEAGLSVTAANIDATQANIATATANVETAKIRVWKAQQDFDRFEKLLADRAITQQTFDAAKAELQSAQSALEAAKKQQAAIQVQTTAAGEQTGVSSAIIAQRKADLEYAKLQLTYANVISPVSGQVSKKNVQPGQYVSPGQQLFSIVADSDIWVVANFKETQLTKMAIGQDVEVTVDAFRDQKIHGKVASFSGATGARFSLLPPDNATGNFVKVIQRMPVKIKINADKSLINKLHPGMSVNVSVSTKS